MGIIDWIFGPKNRSNRETTSTAQPIELTDDFKRTLELLEGSKSPIFVTGNAGTGKSTLLQYFRSITKKNIILIAPTGMAALNIRGVTIHSFFKFPLKLIQHKDIRINHEKVEIFKKIDAIVIDEVSMVRADLMDAIDISLRLHRVNKEPFGGVQMIFFGDICQLPPVVTNDLKSYFSTHYPSPYFFSAKVLQQTGMYVFELQKVFRQSDDDFISILNRIRRAESSIDDMEIVNNRYTEINDQKADNPQIILTPTNKKARQINQEKLDQLRPPEFVSEAMIKGTFNVDEKSLPAESRLVLRKNATIMMVNNNGRDWVNGSLGRVTGWDEKSGKVKVILATGPHIVEREKWEVLDYQYNKETKHLEEHVLGSFEQFPIKLAWAITIHKSQGKTFESVCIDMDKGAFASGQLYVALSRCKSLQKIKMRSLVSLTDLCFDERLRCFIDIIKTEGHVNFSDSPMPVIPVGTIHLKSKEKDHISQNEVHSDFKQIIDTAMTSQTKIKIDYKDFTGNKSTRVVTPKQWIDPDIFTAICHLRNDDRNFRVSRIRHCRFTLPSERG